MSASYVGTTAASSVANPPICLIHGLGGQGNQTCPGNSIWSYCSTNTTTEVTTANFFTDGQALGMKVGDIVFGVYQTSVGSTSPIPYMGAIGQVSTAGANIATATT